MQATEGQGSGQGLARGVVLVAIAVVLGAVLLLSFRDNSGSTAVGPVTDKTTTTKKPSGKATTTSTTVALPALRNPAEIKVISLNGTGSGGLAKTVSTLAKTAGYTNQLAPADATAAVQAATKVSVVYFVAGLDREASALAVALGLAASAAQPLPATAITKVDLRGAQLVILAGPELVGKAATTTAKPTGTTKATAAKTTTTVKP